MKNIIKNILTFISRLILSALFFAIGTVGWLIMAPYNGQEVAILNFFIVISGFILIFIGFVGSFFFLLWGIIGSSDNVSGVGACDGLGY